MNPETLLKELIAISSETGHEEELCAFVFSLLAPYFTLEKRQVLAGRSNLIAVAGTPRIWLNTHLDTVAVGPNMLREDTERIYGRGSCDAKGSMSAMICAAISLRQEGVTDFGLFFDVGEEEDFCGILCGLPEASPRFVIIGEPTDLSPVIGQRGLLGLKVIGRGTTAHGSTPERGVNAIIRLARAIDLLQRIEWPTDKLLGPTSFNIGLIKGGIGINVVPDYAEMSVEIRIVTNKERYTSLLNELLGDYDLEYSASYEPVMLSDVEDLTRVRKLVRTDPTTLKAFSELFFWPRGIILGPGSLDQAHSDHEYVSKAQLHSATGLYRDFVLEFTKANSNL
ncbi:MAG TPA: M20/M25/M40 family metallo-hydrolase, partial [Candidatus Nanoarchaeia archaeon]|nr:M20/M25/M40 family metallo-hydrolase [Candidatus Nanoarchaeia archaeon]